MSAPELSRSTSEIFAPDGSPLAEALLKTTHLGVGAHQDDLEFMAAGGILECFARNDRWFSGVVVTDGAGSPRALEYANFSDEQMRAVRRVEQRKAAFVGEYAVQVLLDHPSSAVKQKPAADVVRDLVSLLEAMRPQVVYTHNLADKHDTHVAVTLRLIDACRKLPSASRPAQLIGCEVWRDLDWLSDEEKVTMPLSGREHLQMALMGVFDSQIAGGKRYDLATIGRRRANATYSESHGTDRHTAVAYGMDLTPLIQDPSIDPTRYAVDAIRRFERDVEDRIARLG